MIPNSVKELARIRNECELMVTTRAVLSSAAAIAPVPGADFGADVMLLLEMIPMINRKFGLGPEQIDQLDPQIKKLILVAATSIGSEMIGKVITQAIILQALKRVGIRVAIKQVAKYLPVLGQAVAAAVSFGAMKAVGNSHVDDCFEVAKRVIEAQEKSAA